MYTLYHRIGRPSPQCPRRTIRNDNSKFQTTVPRTRFPRLGINFDNHLARPDFLCGTTLGKETYDGVHQYLFLDRRY